MTPKRENPVTWNQVGVIFYILIIIVLMGGYSRFIYLMGRNNYHKKVLNNQCEENFDISNDFFQYRVCKEMVEYR